MAHFLQKLSRIFELVLTNDFVEDLLGKDPDLAVLVIQRLKISSTILSDRPSSTKPYIL